MLLFTKGDFWSQEPTNLSEEFLLEAKEWRRNERSTTSYLVRRASLQFFLYSKDSAEEQNN